VLSRGLLARHAGLFQRRTSRHGAVREISAPPRRSARGGSSAGHQGARGTNPQPPRGRRARLAPRPRRGHEWATRPPLGCDARCVDVSCLSRRKHERNETVVFAKKKRKSDAYRRVQ
jgi:hypothetical protein